MHHFLKFGSIAALSAMVMLAGCSKENSKVASAEHSEHDGHDHSGHDHDHNHDHAHDNDASASAEEASPELKKLVLTSGAPVQVEGVAKARETVADGQEVTVEGRLKDFIAGKAAFTMVDGSINSCIEEGDGCTTPWDYCCIAPPKLAANSATVKLVDEAGKIMDGSLKGVNSIDNLSTVVVTGKAQKDEAGNLTIAASNVYLK